MPTPMSLDMHGGAGEGGDGENVEENLVDVFGYLKNEAKNGIAINGILVWIDVQQKSTPPDVWIAQASYAFCEGEVEAARSALWKAVGVRKELIGEIIGHKSPGKKIKNLEDIHKAMITLKEKEALPMLLCSNGMVPNFPAFHCDKKEMDTTDVLAKMKVLEQSMSSFMKQNNDQMRVLTDTIATVKSAPATWNNTMTTSGNDADDTPGTKKRKMDGNAQMGGITPIPSGPPMPPGMNFAGAAMKNHHQMFQPSFLQQQQERVQNQSNQKQENQPKTGRRRPSTLLFGKAKDGNQESEKFLFAADVNLVASGVSKDATPEQLKEFIVSKGIQVTDIELLTNHKVEARYYSYRIAIKAADYDKALQPEVWPYRVGVRLFKPKRFQPSQNSWSQQSSQTGGNVMNQSRANGNTDRRTGQQQPTVPQPMDDGQLDTQNRYVAAGFESEVFN